MHEWLLLFFIYFYFRPSFSFSLSLHYLFVFNFSVFSASQLESESLSESSGTWWSFLETVRAPKPQKKQHLVSIRVLEPLCIAPELFLMAITHWDSSMEACMGLLNGTSLNTPFIARVIRDKTIDCTKETELQSMRGEMAYLCSFFCYKNLPCLKGGVIKSSVYFSLWK